MWKPSNSPVPPPVEAQPIPVKPPTSHQIITPANEHATIGKSLTIRGEIIGSEPLHIEGRVDGKISLEGGYLNIGPEAQVHSVVNAREVVVRGRLEGNVTVTERVDIRNGGSLTGDVVAHRVSIEDGALFKGSIDMRRNGDAEIKRNGDARFEPKPAA